MAHDTLRPCYPWPVTKAFSLFLVLCMLVQVIRPLGLPGLRRRTDAWKLAVGAFVVVMAVAVVGAD